MLIILACALAIRSGIAGDALLTAYWIAVTVYWLRRRLS